MALPTFGYEDLLVEILTRLPICSLQVSNARKLLLSEKIDPTKLIVADADEIRPSENANISVHNRLPLLMADLRDLYKEGIHLIQLADLCNSAAIKNRFQINLIDWSEHPSIEVFTQFFKFIGFDRHVEYSPINDAIELCDEFFKILAECNYLSTCDETLSGTQETLSGTQEFEPTCTSSQIVMETQSRDETEETEDAYIEQVHREIYISALEITLKNYENSLTAIQKNKLQKELAAKKKEWNTPNKNI